MGHSQSSESFTRENLLGALLPRSQDGRRHDSGPSNRVHGGSKDHPSKAKFAGFKRGIRVDSDHCRDVGQDRDVAGAGHKHRSAQHL